MNLETASEIFGAMNEAVEAAAVPDQHNEEASEAEVLPEWASGATEDMDVDESSHHSANVGKMDESVEAAAVTDQYNE